MGSAPTEREEQKRAAPAMLGWVTPRHLGDVWVEMPITQSDTWIRQWGERPQLVHRPEQLVHHPGTCWSLLGERAKADKGPWGWKLVGKEWSRVDREWGSCEKEDTWVYGARNRECQEGRWSGPTTGKIQERAFCRAWPESGVHWPR